MTDSNQAQITIKGFELVQSIQNAKNDVTLLQGKDTFLRVYYCHGKNFLKSFKDFTCELTVSFDGSNRALNGEKFQILNPVAVEKMPDPEEQRFRWRKSLNFKIPAQYLTRVDSNSCDSLSIKFTLQNAKLRNRRNQWSDADKFFNGNPTWCCEEEFEKPSVLRIRLVGYRYSDFEQLIEEIPKQSDFAR